MPATRSSDNDQSASLTAELASTRTALAEVRSRSCPSCALCRGLQWTAVAVTSVTDAVLCCDWYRNCACGVQATALAASREEEIRDLRQRLEQETEKTAQAVSQRIAVSGLVCLSPSCDPGGMVRPHNLRASLCNVPTRGEVTDGWAWTAFCPCRTLQG